MFEFGSSHNAVRLGLKCVLWMEKAKKQRRTIVALGVVLACCTCASALDPSLDVSQYAHTSWKPSEAFGKGTIWAFAQTPDGYLWIATEFGLRRFDGVRTVEWKPPAGEYLPDKDIRTLLATRDGTLWIGTSRGLVSWKDGKVTHYREFEKHDMIALLQDREGTVWAAGKIWEAGPSQPGKFCAINNGGVHCFGSDGSFGFGVTSIYEDSHGNLWLGAANGIWRWKPGPPKHYPVPELFHTGAGLLFAGKSFLEDSDGALLITEPRGIHRFIDGKLRPYPLPLGAPQVNYGKLMRDRDGSLWIGTLDAGLLHIHQGRMDVFAQTDGLSNSSVESLFEDREGTIWIGGSVLECFRDYAVPTISVKQGLSPSVTSVLATRDGSVWIGTTHALNRWKNGQITIYRKQTAGAEPPQGTRAIVAKSQQEPGANVHDVNTSELPDNFIGSLYQEPHGRIWISTARGLAYFEGGRFLRLSDVRLPAYSLSPVARDNAGNLWMTSDQGLHRLLGGSGAEYLPSASLGLRGSLATLLVADPIRGGLWVGSWQGGVAYYQDGQVRSSYGPADGLGEDRVNALQVDSENALWAATHTGLSRIKDGRVATLASRNGLPCDEALSVAEDDAHSLWVYMGCGLVRISRPELDAWFADPKRQIQATVLDTSDGVEAHPGVLQYAPRMTTEVDGKVWFVTTNGVSVVDPSNLHFNKLAPPVHIEQIIADRKNYYASHLRLPPRVRDLEIDYTALSFVAPEKVLFRYKLEGWDRGWQDVGTRRQAFYSNLPPRKYRFRLMACNNSGVWNEQGASLDFVIPPAWYQTNWFRALCAAVFLALLWTLYQLRLHQLSRLFDMKLEARVGERTRIARELHDTLLQSLHGLMFQFQAARNLMPKRPDDAMRSLDDAINETEKALAESRDAIHGLRSEPIATGDLADLLMATSKELACTAKEPPVFKFIEEGERQTLSPAVQSEVCRIALEILRNAYRHARAHQIEAEIRYGAQIFRVRIRDDGRGIDPEVLKEGAGAGHWGLRGMRERSERIGAQLEFWSEAGAGTEVQLAVPADVAYESSRNSFGFKLFRSTKS